MTKKIHENTKGKYAEENKVKTPTLSHQNKFYMFYAL